MFVKKYESPTLATPKGKNRCPTCEQLFKANCRICPHCKSSTIVKLNFDSVDSSDEDMGLADEVLKFIANKDDVIHSVFVRAMELRVKNPEKSKALFRQVLELEPEHFEARLKLSWHLLHSERTGEVPGLLEPIISSEKSTVEQKQRAYNNLSCAFLAPDNTDAPAAEKWAKAGIDTDGTGTTKLWDNLGCAYRKQGKLREALDAFTKSLLMNPKSKHSKQSIKLVEMEIKRKDSKPPKKERAKKESKSKKEKGEKKFATIDSKEKENSNILQRTTSAPFVKQKRDNL
jgi:tetratricopeptide (TPR) repeat protein